MRRGKLCKSDQQKKKVNSQKAFEKVRFLRGGSSYPASPPLSIKFSCLSLAHYPPLSLPHSAWRAAAVECKTLDCRELFFKRFHWCEMLVSKGGEKSREEEAGVWQGISSMCCCTMAATRVEFRSNTQRDKRTKMAKEGSRAAEGTVGQQRPEIRCK